MNTEMETPMVIELVSQQRAHAVLLAEYDRAVTALADLAMAAERVLAVEGPALHRSGTRELRGSVDRARDVLGLLPAE